MICHGRCYETEHTKVLVNKGVGTVSILHHIQYHVGTATATSGPYYVFDKFRLLKPGDVCISSVTLAELYYGVEKSEYKERNRFALIQFLAPVEVLPFSDKASLTFGKIRTGLEKNGEVIGAYDMMIAAHCISEDLIMVSNNIIEFLRIHRIKLENWV